jgi:predicted hotdog family 3-hydroxylacyl-ACP dehydratase
MIDFPPIDRLVPHRAPMQLVDRVVSQEGDVVRAEHAITEDHPFHIPGQGVPVYVAFEMMAQTICANDGLKRWRSGKEPAIGFLLGCRKYAARRDFLRAGETVTIESRQLLEGETASFQCRVIDQAGEEVSSGVINVYRPADIADYLKGTLLP